MTSPNGPTGDGATHKVAHRMRVSPTPALYSRYDVLLLEHAVSTLYRSSAGDGERIAALKDIVITAATSPAIIQPSAVDACLFALETAGHDSHVFEHVICALGAMLFARPELIEGISLSGFESRLTRADVWSPAHDLACEFLGHFVLTSDAGKTVDLVQTLLLRPGLTPTHYARLLDILKEAALRRLHLIDLNRLLLMLESDHLGDHRFALLISVVERLVFESPEVFAPSVIERLAEIYADEENFRYVLWYLAERRSAPPNTRSMARKHLHHHFPLHKAIQQRLGKGKRRIVTVNNMADGQGDELIRSATLIQALLDFNPKLRVDVITTNPHWYDHPRITLIPLRDEIEVARALREPADGLVNFHEPWIPEANHSTELTTLVKEYVWKRHPFLHISARSGPVLSRYEAVEVSGQSWLDTLGLGTDHLLNAYEPALRLIAELGLPLRAGREAPTSESVLVGRPCTEAKEQWKRLMQENTHRRPVALVNPFGGQNPLKGFVQETYSELAEQLRGLIVEGFFVVMLPNGTSWGSHALCQEVVARLDTKDQAQVAIAPDPAGVPPESLQPDSNHPALPYRGRVMRWLKYFASFADLVVTVEGWMVHVAYALGKPYRLTLAPYSHVFEWLPYGRSRDQAVVNIFSPAARETSLEDMWTAPLLNRPQKNRLLFQLKVLSVCRDERLLPVLHRRLESKDVDIRLAATRALGRYPAEQVVRDLYGLLKDSSARVRSAAARALLEHTALHPTLLQGFTRLQLEAYRVIDAGGQNWPKILLLGKEAVPALQAALNDDDGVARRECRELLTIVLRESAQNTGVRGPD